MLTIEKLKKMKPHTIFEFKVGRNNERTFMFVAKKGAVNDWAIYTSLNAIPGVDFWAGTKDGLVKYGQKLCDKEKIRELISCDDKVFELYRY